MEGVEDENKKKKDGRANNGALKGIYRGQGRPPKAREKKTGPYTHLRTQQKGRKLVIRLLLEKKKKKEKKKERKQQKQTI